MTDTTIPDQSLDAMLVEEAGLSSQQAEKCLQELRKGNKSLDEILETIGGIDEQKLLQFFSKQLDIPFLNDLSREKLSESFIEEIPVQFARQNQVVGLQTQNGPINVAINRPLQTEVLDELSSMLETSVDPVLASRSEITSAINRAYEEKVGVVDEMLDEMEEEDVEEIANELDTSDDLLNLANKAPIIKLVNMILFRALEMRASDVHIQPYEDKLQIRYRIDGILYDMMTPPKRIQEAIISRIKIMGKMDIAERRMPQDGRTSIRLGDREVDVRISSVPTTHGERIVMRLLDKSVRLFELDELGMSQDHLQTMKKMIESSHGILLDTGPTGSGKTTTLYASLQYLNSVENNILTIEDPVEYQLDGISQIEINPKKGLTFASGLRSIVRQDPDIIMVGEIRDLETASIAIQSALTGHLVFSTLHTNDAPSAVTRLQELGVEDYLVASSIIGVVAQRLVRKICESCKTKYRPPTEELSRLNLSREDLPEDGKLWKGEGCDECMNTGFHDRTGLYELLPMTDHIREEVMNDASATTLKQTALKEDFRTLRMDGAKKVLEGITTIDEVIRTTQVDVQ